MKRYLETRSGKLFASAIVMITPHQSGTDRAFEIDYKHGTEPKTTYATREAVEEFLGRRWS